MSRSLLSYTGSVKICYKIGDKIITSVMHNAGMPSLFRIISKALAGGDVYNDRPVKMDLRQKINNNWVSILEGSGTSSGTSYTQDNSGDWVTRCTATIAYSQILAPEFSQSNEYALFLCSASEDLASLAVPYSDLSHITAGTQAIVEWTLKVTNS